MFLQTIDAWIDIEASPDDIWEVLVDFPKWSEWNPFIPLVEGEIRKYKLVDFLQKKHYNCFRR